MHPVALPDGLCGVPAVERFRYRRKIIFAVKIHINRNQGNIAVFTAAVTLDHQFNQAMLIATVLPAGLSALII